MSVCVTLEDPTPGYNSHPAVHHLNGAVANLVGGFHALGTLLAVAIGTASCISGLLLSYHASLPSSPAIILSAGVVCILSILAGTRGILAMRPAHFPPYRLNIGADRMSRMLKLAVAVSAISLFPAALAAASAENLKVVASFSIIADFAKNVGGDRVDITTLVGPNGDAHVYEPKPADAAAVGAADVVLVNGLQFEGFLQRLVEASGTKASVVELTKGSEVLKNAEEEHHHEDAAAEAGHDHDAEEGQEHAHEDAHGHHHHGEFDPHAWQSVHNAEIYVKNIADAFCAADVAGCDTYKANAAAYGEQLEMLEAEIRSAVAEIPQDRRVIITSHDAFGYFEHEYGLKFLAPEGVSTESEASAADVAALIRQIKEDKASAIFVENITNPRLIEQIASETGIKVGGTLYSDALSDESGSAATYIDMMNNNINTIKGSVVGS